MWYLIHLVGRLWHWFSQVAQGFVRLFATIFNNIWAAWILVLGVCVGVWKFAGVVLKQVVDKLDAFIFPTASGKLPSGWIAYVEFLNGLFPVSEGFTYLLALLSLWVLVFFVKLILKHRPKPFGF